MIRGSKRQLVIITNLEGDTRKEATETAIERVLRAFSDASDAGQFGQDGVITDSEGNQVGMCSALTVDQFLSIIERGLRKIMTDEIQETLENELLKRATGKNIPTA